MPTVQKYQRQVQQSALPGVSRSEFRIAQLETPAPRVTPTADSLGAGFGQVVASEGEQVIAHEQAKQDQIRLLAADGQLGSAVIDLTTNPKTGFRNVTGVGAFDLPNTVGQAFDQTAGKIRAGLGNDRQRMSFDEHSQGVRQRLMGDVNDHVGRQQQAVEAEAVNTKVQNEYNNALLAVDDPDPVKAAQRIQASIDSIAITYNDHNRNGDGSLRSPQDVEDRSIALATSKVLVGAIQRYMDKPGGDIPAKVLFQQVKDQIEPDVRDKLQLSLTKNTALGDSQRITDVILQNADKDSTLSQLQGEIPKHTNDAEVRKLVEEQLKSHVTAQREDIRFQEEQASKAAKQSLDALIQQVKNDIEHAPLDKTFEQIVPQSIRDRLTESADRSLREFHKMITEHKEPKTDPRVWAQLRLEAATDPDTFKKRDLNESIARLSPGDFHELTNLKADILKGKADPAELQGIRTHAQVIDKNLIDIGIDPASKLNEGAKAALWKAVDDEVIFRQSLSKKKISPEEFQKIVDDMTTVTGAQTGTWWGLLPGGGPFVDVKGTPRFQMPIHPGATSAVKPGEYTQTNPKTGEVQVWRNGQWVKP
jgi:uncharacterized protein YjbJ (UPF0337 family)